MSFGSDEDEGAYGAYDVPAPVETEVPLLPGATTASLATPTANYEPAMPMSMSQAVGDVESAHTLGLSLLLPTVGAAAGLAYGDGGFDALAGGLVGGGIVNVFRALRAGATATEEGSREAVVAGTYALIAFGGAGYILWKKHGDETKKKAVANEDEEKP